MNRRSRMRLALVGALAGCGGDPAGPTGAPAPIGGEGIQVGNIFFRSNHNGSTDPAVDTVAVGDTVRWTWSQTGSISHSVRSAGSPGFASSAIMAGNGTTYAQVFTAPGEYRYDCAVHGGAMTGKLVVQ